MMIYPIEDSSVEGHIVSEIQMQVSGFGDVQNRPDGNFQFSDKLQSVMVPLGRFQIYVLTSDSDWSAPFG